MCNLCDIFPGIGRTEYHNSVLVRYFASSSLKYIHFTIFLASCCLSAQLFVHLFIITIPIILAYNSRMLFQFLSQQLPSHILLKSLTYIDLLKTEPRYWSRAFFFNTFTKCDMVDNNLSNFVNNWIAEARYKSILELFDDLRLQVMERVYKKRIGCNVLK